MSLTNPSSASTGTGGPLSVTTSARNSAAVSGSAAQSNMAGLKRTVQAAFDVRQKEGYFHCLKLRPAYSHLPRFNLVWPGAPPFNGDGGDKRNRCMSHRCPFTLPAELDDHPISDGILEDLIYAYDYPVASTTDADEHFALIKFSPEADQGDANKNPISGYTSKVHVQEKYRIVGFISSGTYGRVYKAVGRDERKREYAIKKFKPDKEGEIVQYTGLSQSAIREMALCSELSHPNVVELVEIILEEKCVYMVFEYTEHDLLQIIHHHTQPQRHAIPAPMVKSILYQLLNGLLYLHRNWVLHRDLKPANILVTSNGAIRIGDLGLARLFYKPLNSLFSGDKVVVTIWYRAPELLLGSRHYTPAVDLWAVGCIFAELLSLRPIFKGEEARMDSKKTVPFQRNQMMKIFEIMGIPTKENWPGLVSMPEYPQLQQLAMSRGSSHIHKPSTLDVWYQTCLKTSGYSSSSAAGTPGSEGFDLLSRLLEYDPGKRITAEEALEHPYFSTGGSISPNCFHGIDSTYPHRRVTKDDSDIKTGSLPGTKRSGIPDDNLIGRAAKRLKEG